MNQLPTKYTTLGLISLIFTWSFAASASAEPPKRPSNNLTVTAYPMLMKSRQDTDLAINANFKFTDRLSYFGFLNIDSLLHEESVDIGRSEHNLRYQLTQNSPVDINFQALRAPGPHNDFSQLGLSLRMNDVEMFKELFSKLNLKYRVTLSPIRFGESEPGGYGIEHVFVWFVPGTERRLTVTGFLDQGFDEDLPPFFPENPIISEAKATYAIGAGFALVGQARYNEKKPDHLHNYAFGLERKFAW